MGNRGGALHNGRCEVVRQFTNRRWITCLLEFKGRRRLVMSPGLYTELFFLDEAVALAAGHRPCAECRRSRFNEFRSASLRSVGPVGGSLPSAPEMDTELHRTRIDTQGGKITYEAPMDSLPDGCYVQIDGANLLVWGQTLILWAPEGYVEKRPRPRDATVTVLTPSVTVGCLRAGYRPEIHASALAL